MVGCESKQANLELIALIVQYHSCIKAGREVAGSCLLAGNLIFLCCVFRAVNLGQEIYHECVSVCQAAVAHLARQLVL